MLKRLVRVAITDSGIQASSLIFTSFSKINLSFLSPTAILKFWSRYDKSTYDAMDVVWRGGAHGCDGSFKKESVIIKL